LRSSSFGFSASTISTSTPAINAIASSICHALLLGILYTSPTSGIFAALWRAFVFPVFSIAGDTVRPAIHALSPVSATLNGVSMCGIWCMMR
ncbi:MAG: hypothetical protein IIZ93_12670, partial [Acidaminococcaceae bacterium]|nr:hypothetical protein [Acidaminococcaceae bacterium]